MANKKKALSIVIVETGGLVVCGALNPTGASFPFPPDVISHMEVAKQDVFHAFINSVCTAQQLPSKDIILVFGNSLLFQKQIPLLSEEKLAEEVKNFAHVTPFDWVATKAYKTPTGNTLVAINRDFFDVLKQAFEHNSVAVLSIVPQFVFAQILAKQPLNLKTLESLFSKSDTIIDQTLVASRNTPRTFQQQEEYISKRYSGVIIVGFILFLILVFGITGYVLRQQSQSTRSVPVEKTATTSAGLATPLAASDPTPVANAPSIASPSAVRITIAFGTNQASVSARLRQALTQKGYTSISLQPQSNVTVEKPLMIIRPTLTGTLKTTLTETVQSVLTDFSSQETSDLESDVWITLGN
jgi:hypothetical protein